MSAYWSEAEGFLELEIHIAYTHRREASYWSPAAIVRFRERTLEREKFLYHKRTGPIFYFRCLDCGHVPTKCVCKVDPYE